MRWPIVDLLRALRRVGDDPPILIDVAEAAQREARRARRTWCAATADRSRRRRTADPGPRDRRLRRPTSLDLVAGHVDGAVQRRHLVVVALEALRTEVAEQAAAQRVRAALRDDVDHAARGLSELGLVAAGLDLGSSLMKSNGTPLPSEPNTIEYEPSAP